MVKAFCPTIKLYFIYRTRSNRPTVLGREFFYSCFIVITIAPTIANNNIKELNSNHKL